MQRRRRMLLAVNNTGAASRSPFLLVTTQPVGSTSPNLATQPVVTAKNANGTTNTGYVGTVVPTLNVLTGSATLGGTEATGKACVAGVCTFTNLTVTAAAGATWTITFTSGTLASAVSSTGTTTGNVAPNQPTISAGTPTSSGVTLTGSAFSDSDVGDTHAASQWQVTTAADTGYATPVISTGDDATNKTSYAASGLSASTSYIARVRYKDSAGNYSSYSSNASFTTAAGASNYAIQLAATTGVARTASSVANLEPITGITVRLRVKGALLTPAANAEYFALGDASNQKAGLILVPGSGRVQPYCYIGGNGLNTIGADYAATVITDATAWYDILATVDASGATDKRQFIVWKVGTATPVVDLHSAVAIAALPTTAGQGIVSLGQTVAPQYNSPGLDCDWLAIYGGSPYSTSNSGAGSTAPAAPTTGDTGILHLWNFPENTGGTSADAVGGGPSLTLTNATWEAGS